MFSRVIKILPILFVLLVEGVPSTMSVFSSKSTVSGNTVSTGCWSLPSAILLDSPSDNHYTNIPAVNFTWNSATSTCPTATLSYQFQLATDPLFASIVTTSSWSTNLFYNFNFINEGKYY
jgi:hypothetical protein